MELVKELPEIFEEFAEQRQKSFLVMKEVKDKGIPVIGAYCTYFPQEIAMAMGAVTVGLCSTSDETIPVAEKDLPIDIGCIFRREKRIFESFLFSFALLPVQWMEAA